MDHSEYMSLEALAAGLHLPKRFLRRLASQRLIPALDVNGRLRFDEVQVREALRTLSHRAAGAGPGRGDRRG